MSTAEIARTTHGSQPIVHKAKETRIYESHLTREEKDKVKAMLVVSTTSTENYREFMLDERVFAVQKKADVCGGEPCIGGTRITVRTLFQLNRQGETINQLAQTFSLQPWQVEVALEYAQRNREEIDDLIQENERA